MKLELGSKTEGDSGKHKVGEREGEGGHSGQGVWRETETQSVEAQEAIGKAEQHRLIEELGVYLEKSIRSRKQQQDEHEHLACHGNREVSEQG